MPSTVVAYFNYDVARRALRVRFVSGLVYEYLDVPPEVFEAMKLSRSKGTYLNQNIKGNYEFKKIES